VYSLGDVAQEAFKVDQTVNVKEVEGVVDAHVVKVLFNSIMLLITKQATSQGIQSGFNLMFMGFAFMIMTMRVSINI